MRRGWFITCFLFSLLIDQISKFLILKKLPYGKPVEVLGEAIRFTFIFNPGGLFGIGKGMGWFFVLMGVVFFLLIPFFLRGKRSVMEETGFGLILGGATGNFIDRIRFGAVIDFIDMGYKGFRWPVFNLGDAALSVGIGLVLLAELRRRRDASNSLVDRSS